MRINYRELGRIYRKAGGQRTMLEFREALQEAKLRPEDFSLREAAEELIFDCHGDLCGREFVRALNPRQGGINLLEAGDAVDTSAFSNITGQITYTAILDAYNDPAFIWQQLIRTVPTKFSGEKIPGIGRIGDNAESVDEAQPYPTVGVGQEYVETPATTKRGFIVPVTKEAIFFDRTNLVVDRCREVGTWLSINKEKRVLYEVLGNTTYASGYKYSGTQYDTYQTSEPWINSHSNTLVDWTDFNNALDLYCKMTDPMTDEYVDVMPDTVIVPTKLEFTAKMVINATFVQVRGATNAAHNVHQAVNPVPSYRIVSSPRVYQCNGNSDSTWFLGAPQKAFAYMENWPITVTQAAQNSEADFERDVVLRFKASERGVTTTLNPRYMVKNT